MPIVRLGNPKAQVPGNQLTVAHIPDEYTAAERLLVITSRPTVPGGYDRGIWVEHSAAPAPDWVESDDPVLADALATHYGCPIGRPDGWELSE